MLTICVNLWFATQFAHAHNMLNDWNVPHIIQQKNLPNTHTDAQTNAAQPQQSIDFIKKSVKNVSRSYVKQMLAVANNDDSLYELVFNYSSLAHAPINLQFRVLNAESLTDELATELSGVALIDSTEIATESALQNSAVPALTSADFAMSNGGKIDYVHVSAVPLPTAAWLFGSAIILFCLARRNSF